MGGATEQNPGELGTEEFAKDEILVHRAEEFSHGPLSPRRLHCLCFLLLWVVCCTHFQVRHALGGVMVTGLVSLRLSNDREKKNYYKYIKVRKKNITAL